MPKIGILFGNKKGQMKSTLWLGGLGFFNDQFFSGEVDVRDIDRDLESITGRYIDYRGDVKAFKGQQWNFIFGGSWMFNDYNNLSFEVGVYPRMQAILSYNRSF
jgi:spermidine synthase